MIKKKPWIWKKKPTGFGRNKKQEFVGDRTRERKH